MYAAVLGVSYLSFLLMVLRMRSHYLLRSDTPPELAERNVWTFAGLSAAFLLSIPVFFVTEYAWLMWGHLAHHGPPLGAMVATTTRPPTRTLTLTLTYQRA